jgi:SAM-dependent methyltransferase
LAQPSHPLNEATAAGDRLTPLSGYETLASEYYDPVRHPTCANFREGSRALLAKWIGSISLDRSVVCEVGCGKSLLAEMLGRMADLRDVYLIDSSPSMLAYSQRWAQRGAHLVMGDAEALPLPAQSVDVLVSSLGDPYNVDAFWGEAQRVIRPSGRVLFTTPAYGWAKSFRVTYEADSHQADFELVDGRHVGVPSFILPTSQQTELVERHDLAVCEIVEFPMSALRGSISPKLVLRRGLEASVVTGYAITRQSSAG